MKAGDLRRLYLAGGLFGNAAEWADIAAVAVLAPVLARVYFGGGDAGGATAAIFGALAAGFVARFVGAMLYGHVGDRSPLKGPLLLSAVSILLATLGTALLPGTEQLGAAAGLLFIGLRLLQGMAAAAESALHASVRATLPPGTKVPLLAMLADAAPPAGVLLVLAVAALAWPAGPAAEAEGLWRTILLVAPVLAFLALLLRLALPRTPWQAEAGLPERPAVTALTGGLHTTLRVAAISAPLAAPVAMIGLIGMAALELQPGGPDDDMLEQALVLGALWLASAMLCTMGISAIASARGLTATLRPVLLAVAALAFATAGGLLLDLPFAALPAILLLPALAALHPLLPWRACIAAPDRTLISTQCLAQAFVLAPAGLLLPLLGQPQAMSPELAAALAGGAGLLALLSLAVILLRR